ncbi:MAG TPA: 2-phosphosulfolactate phosphatase [Candidatus Limnocylindrales bacterium]|nr:2-phosphosulfolactate phosphatase [Candidatus Limnocylindrales bacterium]
MRPSFAIDALPESAALYRDTHAIVVVDVFRATTVIVTALSRGHRIFPVATIPEAQSVASHLNDPVLAGEQAGIKPESFDLNNSPAAIAALEGSRPVVLLSSAGTQLLAQARGAGAIYVACMRNVRATAEHLAANHNRVALIGAGTKGEPRPEDQMVCGWMGRRLLEAGFAVENERTLAEVECWRAARPEAVLASPSVDYLRRTSQDEDIDFVLGHVDDVDAIAVFNGQQVSLLTTSELNTALSMEAT